MLDGVRSPALVKPELGTQLGRSLGSGGVNLSNRIYSSEGAGVLMSLRQCWLSRNLSPRIFTMYFLVTLLLWPELPLPDKTLWAQALSQCSPPMLQGERSFLLGPGAGGDGVGSSRVLNDLSYLMQSIIVLRCN